MLPPLASRGWPRARHMPDSGATPLARARGLGRLKRPHPPPSPPSGAGGRRGAPRPKQPSAMKAPRAAGPLSHGCSLRPHVSFFLVSNGLPIGLAESFAAFLLFHSCVRARFLADRRNAEVHGIRAAKASGATDAHPHPSVVRPLWRISADSGRTRRNLHGPSLAGLGIGFAPLGPESISAESRSASDRSWAKPKHRV